MVEYYRYRSKLSGKAYVGKLEAALGNFSDDIHLVSQESRMVAGVMIFMSPFLVLCKYLGVPENELEDISKQKWEVSPHDTRYN